MKQVKLIPGIIVALLILITSLPCQAEEVRHLFSPFEEHGSVMLIIDPDTGAIELANKAAVNFYGYPAGELEKMRIQDINILPPEEVVQEMQLAAAEERNYFNFQHLLASGDIRHVAVYSYPFQWEGETKLYSIIHDVTPRLEAEQALYRTSILIFALGIATVTLIATSLLLHHKVKTRNKTLAERKEAEAAMQARERFLTTILQTTIDGFWVVDNQKRIAQVNDAYCTMSGYSREELLSMTINEIDAVEAPEDTSARIKRIIEKGSELFDTCHRRKDGTIFPLEISVTYLPENGGQHICFCRDITERKQSEKELLKFKAAVEQSADGVAMSDMSGNIVFINNAWAEMHGYTLAEVEGCHLSVFHNKEQLENHVTPFIESLIANGSNRGEVGHTRKDGTTFPTYMTTTVVKEPGGEPFGMLAIAHDITERKKAEEALQESEERFRYLIETMAEGIVLKNASDQYVHWNQTASEVFGIGIDEMKGKTTESFKRQIIREDGSEFQKDDLPSQHTLRTGEPCQNVIIGIRRSPQVTNWFKVNTRPYYKTGDGKSGGVIISFADITERKKTEYELQEQKNLLNSTFQSIQDGISILNTDLTIKEVNHTMKKWFTHKGSVVGKKCYEVYQDRSEPCDMTHFSVIIVEDNEDDLLLMLIALKKAGYAPIYTHVQTRSEFEATLQDEQWQLVISDHAMPRFSAPEALQVLK